MKAERLRLVPQSVVANQAIPLIEAVWNQYSRVSDGLSACVDERDIGFRMDLGQLQETNA